MYQIYSDKLGKVIAYHSEKRVVKRYRDRYPSSIEDILRISKIDDNNLPDDYGGLYLVKYGDTYIQYKYLETVQIDYEVIKEDYLSTHDVLQKLAEQTKSKKKAKKIMEVDRFILKEIEKATDYLCSIPDLERRTEDIERYKNSLYGKE